MQRAKPPGQLNASKLDLAIAYRVYPRVSPTPAIHADDKFKLVELCLGSFKRALGTLRIKIWLLLDGCPPKYEELFRSHFSHEELEIIQLESVGNESTFAMQVDILSQQTLADLVYFAEDDYFYMPEAMVELVAFARKSTNIDFITPYDHPDRYHDSTRRQSCVIRNVADRHWRTTSSTCLTFLASKKALMANRSLFKAFRKGADDCAIWEAITQKASLLDPRVHATTAIRFKIWINTWLKGYKRILFGRSYELWSPIPSVATHMALPYLAPSIDWYREFNRLARCNPRISSDSPLNSKTEVGRERP